MEQIKITLDDFLGGLEKLKKRIFEERQERLKYKSNLTFGIKYLDDCAGGIYSNDLIIIGAKTGVGKTELVTTIAMHNAFLKKRVHYFALEAEKFEIERRIKFKLISKMFYEILRDRYQNLDFNFMDWYYGKLDEFLGIYESEIEEFVSSNYETLTTFYTNSDYTVKDFEKHLISIQDDTDLIILDHLHYFDLEDENENRAMKGAVKKIRNLAIILGKPIILVAHFRKSDRKLKSILPDIEDFHGSSDISKIATKAILIAPAKDIQSTPTHYPTYIHLAKCRVSGDRTRFFGRVDFDIKDNSYSHNYQIARVPFADEEIKWINDEKEKPRWAKKV